MFVKFFRVFRSEPKDLPDVRKAGKWFFFLLSREAMLSKRIPMEAKVSARTIFAKQEADFDLGKFSRLCLCCDTLCSRKTNRRQEITRCPKFAFGICADATMAANDGEALSFREIALLAGVTKQRADMLCCKAQKRLVQAVLANPSLRDYCEGLGLKEVERPKKPKKPIPTPPVAPSDPNMPADASSPAQVIPQDAEVNEDEDEEDGETNTEDKAQDS